MKEMVRTAKREITSDLRKFLIESNAELSNLTAFNEKFDKIYFNLK